MGDVPFTMDPAVMAAAFSGMQGMVDQARANNALLQSTVDGFMTSNRGDMGTAVQIVGADIISNCTMNAAQLDTVTTGVGQSNVVLTGSDGDNAAAVKGAAAGAGGIYHA